MIIFETSRLIVRPYLPGDFENFFRLNGDEEVVRYIRPVQNRSEALEAFQKLLEDYISKPGLGRWAVHDKFTGEFIGSFAIIPLPWNENKIQIGYAFPKENWGKGYATELAVKGLEHAIRHLSLKEIFGITEQPNVSSQKVLLKAGFVFKEVYNEKGIDLNVYHYTVSN
jgi:ribosomal-protein-alanine N-acetyltransferase